MVLVVIHGVNAHRAIGKLQGRLQRVCQPAQDVLPHHQAVHDHLDVMLFSFGQRGSIAEGHDLPVDAGSGIALGIETSQEVNELTFTTRHDRGEDLKAPPLRVLHNGVGNGLNALALNRLSTHDTVGNPGSRP